VKYIIISIFITGIFYPNLPIGHVQGEVLHVVGFAILSYLLSSRFIDRNVFLIVVAIAFLSEIGQEYFTTSRHFSIEDIFCDVLGFITYFIIINLRKMKNLIYVFILLGFFACNEASVKNVELAALNTQIEIPVLGIRETSGNEPLQLSVKAGKYEAKLISLTIDTTILIDVKDGQLLSIARRDSTLITQSTKSL
jgi:hypothetical protein